MTKQKTTEFAEQYLSTTEVCEAVGVARSTLWQWERDGNFPKRRQIGPGRVAHLKSEVFEWMRSRPVAWRT